MQLRFRKAALWIAAAATATALPVRADGLSAERVATGLSEPIYATAPSGDARLFIVQRGGKIVILKDGAVLDTAFLDITSSIDDDDEGGLLGLVFASDYAQSGTFYVYYTGPAQNPQSSMESRVARFSVAGDPATSDVADPTEHIVFRTDQPAGRTNHKGGTVAIRDGFLYLALGDGGSAGDPDNNAQNDATPLGKMLRLDLSIADPTTGDWETWAKGLRNPFRYSFDRQTGDLYIGDVGQGGWEEIDVEPADSQGGRNYGWAVMEGDNCYKTVPAAPPCMDSSLTLPIYEYPHDNPPPCGVAVTGGRVYRGAAIPSLDGQYFFSDYCLGRIWTLVWDGDGGTVGPVEDVTAEIVPDAGTIGHLTALSEDGAGELLFVDLDDGDVFRLVPEPGAGALGVAAAAALAALRRAR